ncbi:CHAT domain-containing protein [Catenuloplanes atrovinosus]|uniref:CHAT domain-containing protein/lipopolysaccharide biosynthesis regulator YciM n=1 Tax=Catenuloplanes atrovinosus TaxID=137266 RepID=A0AAE3YLW6_9ACTN|nr:CHAT domain-containing tetratricopeptide repeat protein [Catenuloplanes atrovinosus]MDR7275407.1 CHAT domain-containing protein/lipopolysaccharide biosynthesis regulator YciM [Catenuloplanes atrovinosus]
MIRARSRHLDRVAELSGQATSRLDRYEIDQARELYRDAMHILESGPPRFANEAVRLMWAVHRAGVRLALGRVEIVLGRPQAARVQVESALRQYEALFPDGSEAVADALTALGAVLEATGEFADADARLQRAVRITRAIGAGPERVAQALTALSLTRQSMGDIDGALAAAREALELPGLTRTAVAGLRGNLAFHHLGAGHLAEALRLCQGQWADVEAMERDGTIPGNTLLAALCRGNLGEVYAQMGQYESAAGHRAAALGMMRTAVPDSMMLAGALSNHAAMLLRTGDHETAEAELREALTICRTHAPRAPLSVVLSQHLAHLWLARDEPDRALATIRETISGHPDGARGGRQFIAAYLVAAAAYAAMDDLDRAALMVRYAEQICDRISPWLAERTGVHTALGDLAAGRGDLDGAIREYRSAIAVSERHRLGAADEPGLETFFAESTEAYRSLIEVTFRRGRDGDDALAFEAAEGIRARTLADLLARRGTAAQTLPPPVRALRERETRLYRRAATLARNVAALSCQEDALATALRGRLAETEQALERLRAEIRSGLPPRLPDPESPVCSMRDAQDRLDERTALVIYEATGESVFLWVLTASSRAFRRLGTPSATVLHTLDAAITALRARGGPEPAEELRRLAEWLLEPVLARLSPGITQLVFSAGGRLAYVPFAALPVGTGRLVDDFVTWSVPSATTMVRFGAAARPGGRTPFAGFAAERPSGGYADLPAARDEVEEAAALFPGARTFVGPGATAAAFRAHSGDARLLHIAAHASIDERQPLYSGILLSPDPDAQDNDPFLSLHDIIGLDLRADLVVCAACDSAHGQLRDGEGLVGFSRAFLAAGASALVLSLWPVQDACSQHVMDLLYPALRAGLSPAEALATALRAARASSPVLFERLSSWSGFIVVNTVAPADRRRS